MALAIHLERHYKERRELEQSLSEGLAALTMKTSVSVGTKAKKTRNSKGDQPAPPLGNCYGLPPDIMVPDLPTEGITDEEIELNKQAIQDHGDENRQICEGCPVFRGCFRYGIANRQEAGIYGSYTETERYRFPFNQRRWIVNGIEAAFDRDDLLVREDMLAIAEVPDYNLQYYHFSGLSS